MNLLVDFAALRTPVFFMLINIQKEALRENSQYGGKSTKVFHLFLNSTVCSLFSNATAGGSVNVNVS